MKIKIHINFLYMNQMLKLKNLILINIVLEEVNQQIKFYLKIHQLIVEFIFYSSKLKWEMQKKL